MSAAKKEITSMPSPKLPLFSTLFGAYGLILDKFKQFVIFGTLFAVVFMILDIASGQTFMCYNKIYSANHFCLGNNEISLGTHLVMFVLICMFLRIWYQAAFAEKPLNFKRLFIPKLADLKIAGGFLIYILTLAVSAFSFYLLWTRVPTPDWKVELAYFSVVSLGFFVPVLALRFFVYFAFFAAEEALPTPLEVWRKTAGNLSALLGGIVLLLLGNFAIAQALLGSVLQSNGQASIIAMLGSEYLSDIAAMFSAACFMNYCALQKLFLFERNDNGQSNNS